ncbi:hypothetical protein [uncultured Clostridium sp.]|nr:hypothetical protein [uncultured Clostridium sp.]MDU4884675.1 hypothetical protein [Clostridium celatum]MDU7077864.1 hypothetical protein [Clostridium celatum]
MPLNFAIFHSNTAYEVISKFSNIKKYPIWQPLIRYSNGCQIG